MPAQLFLSYNSADRTSVTAVQKLLEERGITTFLDRDKLVAGLPWPQALEEGLKAVKAVTVFMGRELGGWQKREMWFALDRQVREDKQGRAFPVIPVLLEGADLTPGFLFANTWIDLRSGLDNVVAAEALNAFERAIKSNGPAPIREGLAEQAAERAATICPYRGLKIFREEDAAFFAGRTAFADQLLDFTRERDLVAVVGPSGSGKSSVVQAGLLPRLRREHPPADTWDAVSFTPGREPFHRLASALIPLLEPHKDEVSRLAMAQELGDNLAVDRTKVETVIRRVIDKSNGTLRLLLVADQFEELFTLATESGRRPFVRALLSALGNAPFTLLVTLRADFYGHIITLDRELSDRLASSQLNIGALTQDELRESITAPAELVGLRFEPGLVERILTDVGSEPGHLPLVEFALTELWHRREGNRLANRAYDEIGGVTGALAQRAESEFKRFTPEEQGVARRLFSRLVRVARPEEAGEDTRQRTDLSDADTSAKRVANKLADSRLLVTGSEASKGIFSVELAHEALIRNWARLRGWLNEDREFLLWRQRLQVHLGEWQEHRYAAGYLLRGAPLSEAERWLLGRPQDLSDAEQQLTRESIALRQREREAEEQRRQAEIENAKRLKEAAEVRAEAEQELARKAELLAEERARQAEKFRLLAAGLGTLLLLTLGIATFAFWERAVARGRELVAVSRSAEDADSDLSVLVAAQSVAATWRWGSTVLPEAEQQLHHSILTSHMTLSGHRGGVSSVVWSSDGKRLATASDDRTAKVWDADTGKELLTLTGHRNIVMSVAWSPAEMEEGQRLATGSGDGTAKVWDAENGKELLTLTGHSNTVSSVAWSPDGKRLATGSWDRTAKVWDASNGKELLTLTGHRDSVLSMTWSPDGERLATGSSDGTAKVWDAETGKELLTLTSHRGSIGSVAWSPDAKRLATGSDDQTAKVWDVDTGKELLTLTGHSTYVDSVAWSADGKRLATGSSDDTAKVWDAGNGKELLTLTGHSNVVDSVAWSPARPGQAERLATGSSDSTAKVWDAGGGEELLTLTGDSSSVDSVAWSSDGKRLATASWDHTAKVWDAGSGKELLTLTGHGDYVWSAAWSPAPDGKGERLATGSADRTAKVWDAASGKALLTLTGSAVLSVAWSPDGKRLATASDDQTAKVWDAETGKQLLTLTGHRGSVRSVAWSPDGKRLATGSSDDTAKVWDAETGKELLTLSHGSNSVGSSVGSVAWSPDGKRLATTGRFDETAKVWDAGSGKELLTLSGHSSSVESVAWSPNGKRLATGSYDGTAKVWDAETGKELLTLGQRGLVNSVAWSPDGKRLATASDDGTVQVYAMDIRLLMGLARQRFAAHPSEEGCKKYLHVDKCPPVPELSFW